MKRKEKNKPVRLKGPGPWSCTCLFPLCGDSRQLCWGCLLPSTYSGRRSLGPKAVSLELVPSLHKGKEHSGTWPRRHPSCAPFSFTAATRPSCQAPGMGGAGGEELLGLRGAAGLETTGRNLGFLGSSRGLPSRCLMKQGFKQVFLGEVFPGRIRAENLTNSANWFIWASLLWAFSHRTRSWGDRFFARITGHSQHRAVLLLEVFLTMGNFQIPSKV